MKKYRVIYMLTHPRHWKNNRKVNTKDNIKRIYEGILWNFNINGKIYL